MAGGDLDRVARRISDELFQAGDQNHDGLISPDEFRVTIRTMLFDTIGSVVMLLPKWAQTSRSGERDFATVLAERRATREHEAQLLRCVPLRGTLDTIAQAVIVSIAPSLALIFMYVTVETHSNTCPRLKTLLFLQKLVARCKQLRWAWWWGMLC